MLSRLIPLKNVEAVIEATAQLIHNKVNVTLEIAGTGPSEPMLRKLVTRLGLDENVSFLGWRQDVMPLLASWDLLAMPSVDEGLPIAALQAMAAARPVVASRVGGLRELVADGVTGRLFPSGDVDALASCIADLAKDRGLLASMGIAGWQRAGQKFSAASMAKQTFDVYDRLLR